jgi:hypothetical protein
MVSQAAASVAICSEWLNSSCWMSLYCHSYHKHNATAATTAATAAAAITTITTTQSTTISSPSPSPRPRTIAQFMFHTGQW